MELESFQAYSDRGPYLNPSDHPYEQRRDEDEEYEDEEDDDDFDDIARHKTKESPCMDQAWAAARIVIFIGALAFTLLIIAGMARADETAILTIAYEASGQPIEGQIAVASVIKTRMAKTGKTAKQVVLKPKQFSCWANGRPTQKRKLTKKEIDLARQAWEAAEPGIYDHYCRYDCRPSWIKSAKQSKRIKDHTFYQL